MNQQERTRRWRDRFDQAAADQKEQPPGDLHPLLQKALVEALESQRDSLAVELKQAESLAE